MSLRSRCEESSACTESGQRPVHPSSPDLSSVIRTTIAWVSLCCCVLAHPPAHAQAVYGSIFGTITDQSGAAVVGAKLTATSVQKGTEFETTTNETGNYNLTHLIPDQYDLRAEAPGFKAVESKAVPVYADQAARVDAQLH